MLFRKTYDILMLLINIRTLFYLKELIGNISCRLVSLILHTRRVDRPHFRYSSDGNLQIPYVR